MDNVFNLDFSSCSHPKELAYFIGFFWADGYNILKNNSCTIEIVKDDMDDISPIFNKVFDFAYYTRHRKNRKPQTSLYCSLKCLHDFFIEMGKYPKTSESHEKIMNYIPQEFLKYFIRGLFDGDGCFYFNGKAKQVYISGNHTQDWDYLLQYFSGLGFNFKIKRVKDKRKYSCIRCTNTKTINNFINWLYDGDDEIYLHRKKTKSLEILNSDYGFVKDKKEKLKFSIIENILSSGKKSLKEICEESKMNMRVYITKLVKNGDILKLHEGRLVFYELCNNKSATDGEE